MNRLGAVRPRVAGGTAIALVLVVVLWYLLLWSHAEHRYDQARAEAVSSAATVQALQAQVGQLRSSHAQQLQPSVQAKVNTEEAAVPGGAEIPQLIDEVNNAATAAGITLTSLSPAAPSSTSAAAAVTAVPTISVGIDGTGGYYQIVDFIDRLQTMPRLMVINGVDLSPGQGDDGLLSFTLATDVFTTHPVAVSGSGTTSGAAGVSIPTTTTTTTQSS